MWSYFLWWPGGARWKLVEWKCKAPVRVPAECRVVSLRAPSNEQVHPIASGARPGSSSRPAVCHTAHWTMCSLTSLSSVVKAALYIDNWQRKSWGAVRAPSWSRTVPPPTGLLRAFFCLVARWKRLEIREQPTQHHGARTAGEKCPSAHRNFTGAGRAPAENSPNSCFYSPYVLPSVYMEGL